VSGVESHYDTVEVYQIAVLQMRRASEGEYQLIKPNGLSVRFDRSFGKDCWYGTKTLCCKLVFGIQRDPNDKQKRVFRSAGSQWTGKWQSVWGHRGFYCGFDPVAKMYGWDSCL